LLLPEDHPLTAAKRFLQRCINKKLPRHNTGLSQAAHVIYQTLRDPEGEQYTLRGVPTKLIGFMWLQFARMFTGETRFGECAVCHKSIEYGPDASFRTRVFCSDACKQKQHRQRVNEAKELRAQKWSVKRIAMHFDTTTDTIKKWLNKKK
jgi:hypothetical protein